MQLGKNFDLVEFCTSQTAAREGIDMTPTDRVIDNLRALVINVLDPLRERLGRPIIVTSGYRPSALNVAIGGSSRSQHVAGQAADIIVPGLTVRDVCNEVVGLGLPFDQLIFEFGSWCHVSYAPRQRHDILTATRHGGQVIYTPGLPA